MAKIEQSVLGCEKCRLYKGATNPVPGHGNIRAKVVFVGEAPGFYEDQEGIPFVGRAGKLLDALLRMVELRRSDVWIGNIIKHRPPENRDPMSDEVKACSPYLSEQLKIINPKVVVTLGRYALNFFVPTAKISEDHGIPQSWNGKVVFPLYHPAAALRNPSVEHILKEDFMKLPKVISGELKPKEDLVRDATDDGQISLI